MPYRKHLPKRGEQAFMCIPKETASDEEVFLILVFVYEEMKRQDRKVIRASTNHDSE
jgi:hypothetical protein